MCTAKTFINDITGYQEYKSNLLIDTTLYPFKWAESQKTGLCAGKDGEKLEVTCTAGGNIKWCSHLRKQSGSCSKTKPGDGGAVSHLLQRNGKLASHKTFNSSTIHNKQANKPQQTKNPQTKAACSHNDIIW